MTPDDLQKVVVALNASVGEAVEKHVNGKIRNMDAKLDAYIKNDEEWKKTVQPVVDAYNTAERAGNFLSWLSRVLLAGAVVAGVLFYGRTK